MQFFKFTVKSQWQLKVALASKLLKEQPWKVAITTKLLKKLPRKTISPEACTKISPEQFELYSHIVFQGDYFFNIFFYF